MKYEVISPDAVKLELWNEESIYTLKGGFSLDKTNLPTGMTYLPKGSLLNVNHTTRVAKLVKTAKVYENAAADATAIKVTKDHALKVGDVIGLTVGSKAYGITAIDTSNSAYDTLTIGTAIGAVTAGDILFEAAAESATAAEKAVANAVNSFETSLDGTPSVTAIVRAYEVIEKKMPYPVHEANKTSLTDRFYFV